MFTNKKTYATYSTLCFLTILVMCLLASPARAGFDVMPSNSEDDSEAENGYYGNAQNETFRRAIESEEPLDVEDRAFLSSVHQKRVEDRWYLNVLVARPSVKLKDVQNRTGGSSATLSDQDVSKTLLQFSTAFGYRWTKWAFDLELLLSEKISYKTDIILPAPPPVSLESDVKLFAIFSNVEYRIPNLYDFLPKQFYFYLKGGLGLGVKMLDSTLMSAGKKLEKSNTSMDMVWNLGLGGRYQLTGNVLLDLRYRIIDLGSASIGPIGGYSLRASDINSTGLFFGIVYQM